MAFVPDNRNVGEKLVDFDSALVQPMAVRSDAHILGSSPKGILWPSADAEICRSNLREGWTSHGKLARRSTCSYNQTVQIEMPPRVSTGGAQLSNASVAP